MIVDENFVNTFEIKGAIYKKVIIVQLNNYKHSMVIKFPASQIEINAEEKKDKKGYFRFINKIEKNEDNINSVEIMPINTGILVQPYNENPFQKVKIDERTGLIIDTGGLIPNLYASVLEISTCV